MKRDSDSMKHLVKKIYKKRRFIQSAYHCLPYYCPLWHISIYASKSVFYHLVFVLVLCLCLPMYVLYFCVFQMQTIASFAKCFVPLPASPCYSLRTFVCLFVWFPNEFSRLPTTSIPSCAVWPDWVIYWNLGNFSKPMATIKLPKSSTFLGNFL